MSTRTATTLGKLPPQAPDLEEAVLGQFIEGMQITPAAWAQLKSEIFYKNTHQKIAEAILKLKSDNNPIDELTVIAQLRKVGELEMIGGPFYITELTSKPSKLQSLSYHISIIHEKYLQRELIRLNTESINEAYEDTSNPFEIIGKIVNAITSLKNGIFKRKGKTMGELIDEATAEMNKPKVDGLLGISTGIDALDKLIKGYQNSQLIYDAGRPGMGKCMGKGTKIIMFDGNLKNVEDIVLGDVLMGDDSTPRNVLSIARGREQMYTVYQNKGIAYRVNESHILSLKRSGTQGQTKHGDVLNIGIRDFLKQSNKFKIRNKGYKVGIDFKEQPLEINPYFLGLWLGDGSPNDQNIDNPDVEIHDWLSQFCIINGLDFKNKVYNNKCNELNFVRKKGSHKNNPLMGILKKINVINNKHIPKNFIVNSRENRMQLLAGLIDTDGFFDKDCNVFEIIQVRKDLAYQIKYLCHTLGLACTIKEVTKGIKSRNFTGQYQRLIISGDLHLIPTKIKRKQAPVSKNKRNVLVTGIKVVKDVIDDYYGFTIDGNHLFLLEDTTVTHNTAKMCSQIKHIAIEQKKKVAAFSLEMKGVSLTYRMWANVSEVETDKIKENRLMPFERDKIENAAHQLRDSGIIINDTPGLDILTFETEGALLVSQGVQIIFIDYVQLMQGDPTKNYRGNRELELSDISKRLKKCANEWDIPIVVLSSLARAVEDRKNCIPILRDLRESGSLEQDADVVIGSWRPEYYEDIIKDLPGVHFENFDLTINNLHGLLVNIVLKCREGKTGKAPSLFVGKYMRVINHPDLINQIEQQKQGSIFTTEEKPVNF